MAMPAPKVERPPRLTESLLDALEWIVTRRKKVTMFDLSAGIYDRLVTRGFVRAGSGRILFLTPLGWTALDAYRLGRRAA